MKTIEQGPTPAVPVDRPGIRPPAHLERLADQARDYAKASSSANTQRAYASDWRHFESWSRRAGVEMEPNPQTIGLYLAACAEAASVRTIERRPALGEMPCQGRQATFDRPHRGG